MRFPQNLQEKPEIYENYLAQIFSSNLEKSYLKALLCSRFYYFFVLFGVRQSNFGLRSYVHILKETNVGWIIVVTWLGRLILLVLIGMSVYALAIIIERRKFFVENALEE